MKKQILVLAFLVMASFIMSLKSFGQINPDPKVSTAPSCVADASSPAAGQLYNYTVDVAATAGFAGTGTYNWYITQDANLLDGTKIMADGGSDFTATGSYQGVAGNTKTIGVTWSAASIVNGNPYYLVVKYSETNGTCSPENIRVFRVKPKNTFWLQIQPANSDGTTASAPVEFCPPLVTGATVTEAVSPAVPTVEYTYGTTTMYALITAGGYTGNWDATLQLKNLADDQTIASITYGGPTPGTFTAPASLTYGNGVSGVWTATLPASTSNTTILVTIIINNNHHQGLADQKINVAIDGSYSTTKAGVTTVLKDLSDAAGICTEETAYADYVDMTIKARPTVSPNAPATFVSDPTSKL